MSERTDELAGFFKQFHSQNGVKNPSETRVKEAQEFTHLLGRHLLFEAASMIHKTCITASQSALTTVHQSLVVIDSCPLSTTKIESELLLVEAELLSCSAAIKELNETVESAAKKEVFDSEAIQRAKIAENNKKVKETNKDSSLLLLPIQVLDHFGQQLTTLATLIANIRLKVALCKEEIALYKKEMVFFANVGVMSCEQEDLFPGTEKEEKDTNIEKDELLEKFRARKDNKKNASSDISMFFPSAALEDMSKQTKYLVNNVFQKATETMRAAGTQADTLFERALETGVQSTETLLNEGFASVVYGVAPSSLTGIRQPEKIGNRPLEYSLTKEEEQELEAQHVELVQEQEELAALDAKKIEVSVRELSQLTSLANEQVLVQNEQFATAINNTEKAQSNMKKALKEVDKTKKMKWSSTRQLIVVLWVCTFVLLVSNYIVR